MRCYKKKNIKKPDALKKILTLEAREASPLIRI